VPSHESECNLISWTSSLLFALQYGLYRHRGCKDKPDLSQIFLLILDTREFPKGTFIKDIEIMEVFAQSEFIQQKTLEDFLQFRKSDRGYYFGEYLTQGDLCIQGRCVQTSMQRIIDVGLFELQPELGDESKWDKWADRVVSLRKQLEVSQNPPSATHAEVRKAIVIAEACFGNFWVVPVAAMLLALKHRKKNDPVIVDGFAAMFTAKEIETFSLKDIKIDAGQLPEVAQFQSLIDDIYRRFTGGDILLLLNPFTNLTITNLPSHYVGDEKVQVVKRG